MSDKIMKTSSSKKSFTEEIKGSASEVIKQIRKLIKEGNARRLMIKNKDGKVLFQTQLTAGLAGSALVTAMAPIASAIGMFALFMNDIKIIVEKYPKGEMGEDEYEVDAEEAEVIVDIEGDDDDEPEEEKTDKTVGKTKKSDDE
ncbi:MAG: DUF4342 domain-containing protein [Balneolaceae bacterium]|nr:DUF4342 domain-containing protein [Balneolaceae bacterium]